MASFNSITLVGNITRDIELRELPSGAYVCEVGIATNRKYYSKNKDEMQEEVCFVDCTAFGKTAEIIDKYLSKGSQVLFQGRLALDTWEDKETGAKRSKHKVIVENMTMLGGKGGGEDNRSPADKFYDRPAGGEANNEDVPF